MDKLLWLTYASMAVWAVLGLYLFHLSRNQKNLEARLERMEAKKAND